MVGHVAGAGRGSATPEAIVQHYPCAWKGSWLCCVELTASVSMQLLGFESQQAGVAEEFDLERCFFTQDFFLQGQSAEKKTDASTAETELCSELHAEQTETTTKLAANSADAAGVRQEQPFIVLSQEEYGEHHSSIMYCR